MSEEFAKACDAVEVALKALSLPASVLVTLEEPKTSQTSTLMKRVLGATLPVIKTKEEKYALGIVLEPLKEMGQVDAQNDLYSAEEVKKAAHLFMEEFANMGVQHTELANSRIRILETWIQRDDAVIEGVTVTKGTWLMAVKFIDDELWEKVKKGEITGFSIGGKASRTPVEA